MARSCSSTSENKTVINSTVIIRHFSPGKDVIESSVEESSNDCKGKNVNYEFVQFYARYMVGKRLTPLVTRSQKRMVSWRRSASGGAEAADGGAWTDAGDAGETGVSMSPVQTKPRPASSRTSGWV
jgi:hypothetical protein